MVIVLPGGIRKTVLVLALCAPLPAVAQTRAPTQAEEMQTVAPSPTLRLRANLRIDGVQLRDALAALERSASVPLLFSPSILPDILVSCPCGGVTVHEALTRILQGSGFGFVERGRHVIVLRESRIMEDRSQANTAHVPADDAMPASNGSTGAIEAPLILGRIVGTVTDLMSERGIEGATVSIRGLEIETATGPNGTFELPPVPSGHYTVIARRYGYEVGQTEVTVAADSVRTDVVLPPRVLSLQGVVATGLVDPVKGVLSPITVGQISREDIPLMGIGGVLENLQGRLAGVSVIRESGEPGSEFTLMLRSPTSVTQSGRPLIVLDGSILTSETTNIEALDIESIEVVKGAAAASLYGSRAAAGVISIRTRRGTHLGLGETLYTLQTQYGLSSALEGRPLPTHHQYLMDPTGSFYVDLDGLRVERADRVAPPPHLAFMDKPYPDPIYDNVRTAFGGGAFHRLSMSAMQNGLDTNYAASLHRIVETAAFAGNPGYERMTSRLNLDHRVGTMSFGISAVYTQDESDRITADYGAVLRAAPDVDLGRKVDSGEFVRIPDPEVPYENPLWTQNSRETQVGRSRTIANGVWRWEPAYWISAMASGSYDWQRTLTRTYVAKGTPLSLTENIPSNGSLVIATDVDDLLNGEAQISLRRSFGRLNGRTTVRGTLEHEHANETVASGTNFLVAGTPTINAAESRSSSSSQYTIRSVGYLWDTALDYDGRYILTVLGRRDGSSLFGAENRWHNYYRVAGAWRMAEEPWFAVPHFDEFKVSYARGTAGGHPPFEAQYESWNVSEAGVTKDQLGNRAIRPEHTLEQELSLDMVLAGRIGLDLTYAWQRTTNQLVNMPLLAYVGYTSQWRNAGTVAGRTIEATLEARLINSSRFSWSTMLVVDRSSARIADWPAPCVAPIWRYWCDGVGLNEIWSAGFLTHPRELEAHHGGAAAGRADEFMINDDGWLVWVGPERDFREGVTGGLWGTYTEIADVTYGWGMPIFERNASGAITRKRQANGDNTSVGLSHSLNYGGLGVHADFQLSIGGDVVNQLYRPLLLNDRHPDLDQAHKPAGLKKPVAYYVALEGGRGNSANLEPASFAKLRTLSASYRLPSTQLRRIGRAFGSLREVTLEASGTNLLSFHRCSCPDPEQGIDLSTRLRQLDARHGFPTTRTISFGVGITF